VPDPRLRWSALKHSALVLLAQSTLASLCAPTAQAGPFDDPGWDASAMVAWATTVEVFSPGYLDASAPGLGHADFGLPAFALGAATTDPYDVVSLGDGGSITLLFDASIVDGVGHDFAVFENGFYTVGGLYAEFAFVEVSSNGVDFARLPAETLNPGSVGGLDPVDPTDYHNLAGRHPLAVGTGFDLADLALDPLVTSGLLDLDDVRFVRLIDVIGDGSTTDAFGAALNDPYPTAFSAGGFDLEAVGVIHTLPEPSLVTGLALGAVALASRRDQRAVLRRPVGRLRSRPCGRTN
jgi:hypothetical protein